MKRFFIYILIIIALGFGAYQAQNKISGGVWENVVNLAKEKRQEDFVSQVTPGPCDQPLLYSVGSVDPRFEISAEEFQKEIAEAEKIWENEIGINLFEYAPAGAVKVNLVFDERQEISRESEVLNRELEKLSFNVDSLDDKYAHLEKDYAKKTAEFEAAVKKYEKKQEVYNEDVSYWNSQGGAPEAEYQKLQSESEELEDDYEKLNKKRKAINKLAKEINALAEKEGRIVSDYNRKINTYKNKYGESREFEKGVYNGQEINIYQFNETNDLRLVLAHELGHALGIGHTENPESLMFYLMAEQDVKIPELSSEDIQAVNNICR